MKPTRSTIIRAFLTVTFVAIVCSAIMSLNPNSGFMSPLKQAVDSYDLTDIYFSFHRKQAVPAHDGISVVLMDVSNCRTRAEIADVIDRVNVAQPRLVALDIIFPEAVVADADEDRRLVEALSQVENLVIASELRQVSGGYSLRRSFFVDKIDASEGVVCLPGGIIREWDPVVEAEGQNYATFAKVIADQLSLDIPPGQESQIINYSIDDNMVIEAVGQWNPEFLRGQVVLLGDMKDARDTYQIPLTLKRSARQSGVNIHRQILHTCMSQKFFKSASPVAVAVVSFFLLFLMAIFFVPVMDEADMRKSLNEDKFRASPDQYTILDYLKGILYRHASAAIQTALMILTIIFGYMLFWKAGYLFDFKVLLMGYALLYVCHQLAEAFMRFVSALKVIGKNNKRK